MGHEVGEEAMVANTVARRCHRAQSDAKACALSVDDYRTLHQPSFLADKAMYQVTDEIVMLPGGLDEMDQPVLTNWHDETALIGTT